MKGLSIALSSLVILSGCAANGGGTVLPSHYQSAPLNAEEVKNKTNGMVEHAKGVPNQDRSYERRTYRYRVVAPNESYDVVAESEAGTPSAHRPAQPQPRVYQRPEPQPYYAPHGGYYPPPTYRYEYSEQRGPCPTNGREPYLGWRRHC